MTDQPSAVSGAFRRPFPEQVAFFRNKLGNLVPTQRWDDLTGAAHDTAFMVAGAQKADLLSDLAVAVDKAIAQGASLETFRKDFAGAVERHDWHGWTGEDTKGGRAWRTRTIYRTNSYVSYSAGRRAQLEAADWPFWVYLHGGSKDPRPEHLNVFNGLVLPPDHPFWVKFFPPSDWGCSCYVVGARSLRGARRLGGDPDKTLPAGWDKVDPATGEPAGIGKGWGYAPGASVVAAVQAKVAGWDGQIATAFLEGLPSELATLIAGTRPKAIVSVRQLTPDEVASFQYYSTTSGCREINTALRTEGKLTPEAAQIDDVLGRASLPARETVYRGIRDQSAIDLRAFDPKVGDVISDPAFASTSRLRQIGEDFRASDPNGVLMIIQLPMNAKALYISPISRYGREQEVLAQRDMRLTVTHWDPINGIIHLEAEQG